MSGTKGVQGPDGELVTLSSLPVGNPGRWLPAMKARVVAAVEGELISREEVSRRYRLSHEEYVSWRKAFAPARRGATVAVIGKRHGHGAGAPGR